MGYLKDCYLNFQMNGGGVFFFFFLFFFFLPWLNVELIALESEDVVWMRQFISILLRLAPASSQLS